MAGLLGKVVESYKAINRLEGILDDLYQSCEIHPRLHDDVFGDVDLIKGLLWDVMSETERETFGHVDWRYD